MKQTFIEYLLHSRHCVGYIKMNMIECLPSESGQCLRYLVYIYTHTPPYICSVSWDIFAMSVLSGILPVFGFYII